MLSVLIDAIGRRGAVSAPTPAAGVSPPTPVASTGTHAGGLATGAAIPLPPLRPGAEVFARVIAVTPDGDATIAIGDRLAAARIAGHALPEAARQPGATLLLRVDATGETPRFTLIRVEPRAPAGPRPDPRRRAIPAGPARPRDRRRAGSGPCASGRRPRRARSCAARGSAPEGGTARVAGRDPGDGRRGSAPSGERGGPFRRDRPVGRARRCPPAAGRRRDGPRIARRPARRRDPDRARVAEAGDPARRRAGGSPCRAR